MKTKQQTNPEEKEVTNDKKMQLSPKEFAELDDKTKKLFEKKGIEVEVLSIDTRVRVADYDVFRKALEYLSLSHNEISIKLSEEEARIEELDPATVAANQLIFKNGFLKPEAFKEEITISCSIDSLLECLKNKPPGAELTLVTYGEEYLGVEVTHDNGRREFELPMPERYTKNHPDLDWGEGNYWEAQFFLKDFNREIRSAMKEEDSIHFLSRDELLVFTQDVDVDSPYQKVRSELVAEELVVKGDEEQKARYSVEYLKKFFHASKGVRRLFDEVSVVVRSDHPVIFRCEDEWLALEHVIAPRIEND